MCAFFFFLLTDWRRAFLKNRFVGVYVIFYSKIKLKLINFRTRKITNVGHATKLVRKLVHRERIYETNRNNIKHNFHYIKFWRFLNSAMGVQGVPIIIEPDNNLRVPLLHPEHIVQTRATLFNKKFKKKKKINIFYGNATIRNPYGRTAPTR